MVVSELLKMIACGLVENPDNISVTEDKPDENGLIVYHIHVKVDEAGRIIGKQGRIIKAIRTIVSAIGIRNSEKLLVKVD